VETPSPEDARRTLEQLTGDQTAVRYPPLPRWFFPVQAALVAGISLAQLLPSAARSAVMVGCALGAVLLGARYWLNREGVSWVSLSVRDMAPFLLGVYGTLGACWVLAATTGARWTWVLGAVVTAAIVLRTGQTYRKAFGDAA
jgi:hypothetical protein